MKEKAVNGGFCLFCGKKSEKPFCDRQCYLNYVRQNPNAVRDYEKQQRDKLTDRIVKRNIYINSKGSIKFSQITPEMIIEKRAAILAWREKKNKPKTEKSIRRCKVCGEEITGRLVYCSDECRKEKARRSNVNYNKQRKTLKKRLCKECTSVFVPEYGNKRREFCSDICLKRYNRDNRKAKEKAKENDVYYEYVNPLKVFKRDGWRCQLCGKKLNPRNRGKIKDNAPELDHIIPWSKGGEHSYRNTQCACRKCNGDKGAKERGQLRLFG